MQPVREIIDGRSSASLNCMRVSLAGKRPWWHYHPEVELTFMAQGQARMQVGDHVTTCQAGDLVVLGPDLPHDFNPADPSISCEFFVAQFRREVLSGFPELSGVQGFLDNAGGGLLLRNTPSDLAGFFGDIAEAPPVRRLALLLDILATLKEIEEKRWQPLSRRAVVRQVAEGKNHQRLQVVIECILENFHRRIGLEEMANLVHMAPPSFSRWFRHTIQMTFTDYLNRVRIEECCRQLRFTDKRVTMIAKDCGFESFSSFNRQFRRLKHCTPGEWRRGDNRADHGEPVESTRSDEQR